MREGFDAMAAQNKYRSLWLMAHNALMQAAENPENAKDILDGYLMYGIDEAEAQAKEPA